MASASLGQVYRGVLASTGQEVAVKVQRPGVEPTVALDVYLLRRGIGVAQKAAGITRDLRCALAGGGAGRCGTVRAPVLACASQPHAGARCSRPLPSAGP